MTEKSTAFAVIGDRYHNSDYIRTALGKTLVGDLGLTIDFTDDVKSAQRRNLARLQNADHLSRRHDLAPRLRRGGIAATKCERATGARGRSDRYRLDHRTTSAQAAKDFVEGGGVALFYHNSTYIARGNATFRAVLGAATEGHPPVRPFKVRLTEPRPPHHSGCGRFHCDRRAALHDLRWRSSARFYAEHQRRWVGVQRAWHSL